jgi:DMSO/TMAO reductase YedYZ heme-binding membrane subunit
MVRPDTTAARPGTAVARPDAAVEHSGTAVDRPDPAAARRSPPAQPRTIDSWMGEDLIFSAVVIKKQSLILFLCRLPAFVPLFFIMRGWLSLNEKDVLTNTEADVLGTGGEICFFIAVSITPLITMTGARWIAPLRRWYGIMFAVIGIGDAITAALTTDFTGGIFGRLAGHTFLVTGFLIILLALPLLATANTPSQRKLGKYRKRLQKMTYVIWGFVILHLLLLDGFRPFGASQGDGDPVFHQKFYQTIAVTIPLVLLRLPPIRRWVAAQRAAGTVWKVWLVLAPLVLLYAVAFVFMINEEIFTGTKVLTMHPSAN